MIKDVLVYRWMRNDYDLKGIELHIHAIIYGDFIDGNHKFNGGLSLLSYMTGATKQGILKSLKSLVAKGLIKKEVNIIDGFRNVSYYPTVMHHDGGN